MMDAQLERKLIECLTLIDEGEPIERILARFPEDAARLRPLLETVGLLQRLPAEPDLGAQRASRRAFLNQAAELREQQARRPRWLPSRMLASLAAVLVVLFLAGGAAAASQRALPGSPLYAVKRAVETAGLLLAPQNDKAALAASYEQRRRDEVRALLSSGAAAEVRFTGTIESLTPGQWLLSGLPVTLNAATSITGTPAVGARAEVQGSTSGGQLLAAFITIETDSVPAPTATPVATSVPSAVATATQPTAIATPPPLLATATPSAEPSEQASTKAPPQPTQQPIIPTPTSVPLPSATPVPPSPVPPTPVPPTPTTAPAPPTEFEFSGTVERIGSTWQISGQIVEIDGNTEIRDTINIGTRVKVRALRYTDGRVVARRIERDNSGGDNSGGGGGDNSGGGGDNSGGGGDNSGGGDDNSGGGGDNSGGGGGDNSGGGGDNKNNDNSGHGGGGGGDNKNSSDAKK